MTEGGLFFEQGAPRIPRATFARETRGERESAASSATAAKKWCPSCERLLEADAFRAGASWCIACHVEALRRWRAENPEAVAAYNARRRREYREANPLPEKRCVECDRPFEPKRTDAILCGRRRCKDRRWRRLNPEKARERDRLKAARRRERNQ